MERTNDSIIIGRLEPGHPPLVFPTATSLANAVDDLPDCLDEDSESDSPIDCLSQNDQLLEELFFSNSVSDSCAYPRIAYSNHLHGAIPYAIIRYRF